MDPAVVAKSALGGAASLETGKAPAAIGGPAAAAAAAVNILQPRKAGPTVLQPRRVAPEAVQQGPHPTAVSVLQPRRVAPTAVNVLHPRKSNPATPAAPVAPMAPARALTTVPAEDRPAKQRRVAPQLVSTPAGDHTSPVKSGPRRVTPVLVSAAAGTR